MAAPATLRVAMRAGAGPLDLNPLSGPFPAALALERPSSGARKRGSFAIQELAKEAKTYSHAFHNAYRSYQSGVHSRFWFFQ
jgi:hypothetical protein